MEFFALLDDCAATPEMPTSRLYTGLVREYRCEDPRCLEAVWSEAENDLRAGRHGVVLADYEWGTRLLQTGDQGWGAGDEGALRLLLFAAPRRLSSQEVDIWLAEREAEVLAGSQYEQPMARSVPQLRYLDRRRGTKDEPGRTPPRPMATKLSNSALNTDLPATSSSDPAVPAVPAVPAAGPAGVYNIRSSLDPAAFNAALDRIQALLLAGETYQVNYTYRLDFQVFGSPFSLYRRLRASQPVPYGAFLSLPPATGSGDPTWVLSCSPELFLRHRAGLLQARPMKGTAPRGADAATDAILARQLGSNAKTRAENLMIVDLLRNDLGRMARTGSVRVPALFQVEAHPSLWQMTSTIEAELPPWLTFPQVLRATFPCGSVTGAPKHRTMHWIRQLETQPRGFYTGAIGWIDPPAWGKTGRQAPGGLSSELLASGTSAVPTTGVDQPALVCGDFCLSVAIRTLILGAPALSDAPLAPRPGTLGIGAGIVSDSQADEEYAECQLKARFLTGLDPGFSLFETLYATRTDGIRHLERHLERLRYSAECLGFRLPLAEIRSALDIKLAALPTPSPYRLRLDLHHDGRFTIGEGPLETLPPGPVGLLIARDSLDAADPLLRFKTSRRPRYDAAIAAAMHQGAFDMLFCNRQGLLTEGGRTNVFLRIDGAWLTPPLAAGVLPGVMRGLILDDPTWGAREALLTLADLLRADQIRVSNALRGLVEARLLET